MAQALFPVPVVWDYNEANIAFDKVLEGVALAAVGIDPSSAIAGTEVLLGAELADQFKSFAMGSLTPTTAFFRRDHPVDLGLGDSQLINAFEAGFVQMASTGRRASILKNISEAVTVR